METDWFITSAMPCIHNNMEVYFNIQPPDRKSSSTFTSIYSDIADFFEDCHQAISYLLFIILLLIYCRFGKFVIEEPAFSRFRKHF